MYELKQVAIEMVKEPPIMSYEKVDNADKAVELMTRYLEKKDRENLCVLNLKNDLTPINFNIVSTGTVNQSIVHPREIFKSAVLSNAASIILFHNHLGGSAEPSQDDIETTKRIIEAGKLMGIELMDHIIASPYARHYSFHDERTDLWT